MSAGINNKLPYGNLPRLLLAWVCTEAVRTQNRELILGRSLADFMRSVGVYDDGGAVRRRLRNQMQRLFRSHVELVYEDAHGSRFMNSAIADSGEGAGWGGGVAVQETPGAVSARRALTVRDRPGLRGRAAFFGTPPRSRFWVSARGIPQGWVSACGGEVFLYHFFRGGVLDDEPAVLRNAGGAMSGLWVSGARSRVRGSPAPSASRCGVLLSLRVGAGAASGSRATVTDADWRSRWRCGRIRCCWS